MMRVFAFDFDGTITTKDTLIEFIRYAKGTAALCWGLLIFSPLLILMRLRIYSNHKAKQRLFGFYFKGMPQTDFQELCFRFAKAHISLLKEAAIAELYGAYRKHEKILIVSASIEDWVQPFFNNMPEVTVTGTKIEVINGKLTGKFASKNCYGIEKVRRIKEIFPNRKEYKLIAFGDSSGDKEMLEYADKGYYKPFT